MRILLILLFASLFVSVARSNEQSVSNADTKVKSVFFANKPGYNHPIFQETVYVDQDSNETNDSVLVYIEIAKSFKPVFREITTDYQFVHCFYQNHLTHLILDLPPPQIP